MENEQGGSYSGSVLVYLGRNTLPGWLLLLDKWDASVLQGRELLWYRRERPPRLSTKGRRVQRGWANC